MCSTKQIRNNTRLHLSGWFARSMFAWLCSGCSLERETLTWRSGGPLACHFHPAYEQTFSHTLTYARLSTLCCAFPPYGEGERVCAARLRLHSTMSTRCQYRQIQEIYNLSLFCVFWILFWNVSAHTNMMANAFGFERWFHISPQSSHSFGHPLTNMASVICLVSTIVSSRPALPSDHITSNLPNHQHWYLCVCDKVCAWHLTYLVWNANRANKK